MKCDIKMKINCDRTFVDFKDKLDTITENNMMTSANGNIFHVTDQLCGEFTGHRWIPLTKTSDAELWCFIICAWTNGCVKNRGAGDLRQWRHYNNGEMVFNVLL